MTFDPATILMLLAVLRLTSKLEKRLTRIEAMLWPDRAVEKD